MTTTPQDEELTDRLHQLTATIDGPVAPAELVRRGRAKVMRRRVVSAAAVLSVVGVAGVVVAATGLGGDRAAARHDPGFAVAPTATVSSKAAPSPPAAPTCDPMAQVTLGAGSVPQGGGLPRTLQFTPVLNGYRDVLVQHLDPQQRHVEEVQNVQGGSDGSCAITSLGTKLGWKVPGEAGLGVVQVEVTTAWKDAQTHLAHDGWRPADSLPAGAVSGYVAEYDGGTAVAVTREDGTTVALDANTLFGNNSTTPLSGMQLTVDQLLETAADPGLALP